MDFFNLKYNPKKSFARSYSCKPHIEMGTSNITRDKMQVNPILNLLSDCKAINSKEAIHHKGDISSSYKINSMSVSYILKSFIGASGLQDSCVSTSNSQFSTVFGAVIMGGNSNYPKNQEINGFQMGTQSTSQPGSGNSKWKSQFFPMEFETELLNKLEKHDIKKPMRTYAEVTKQNLKSYHEASIQEVNQKLTESNCIYSKEMGGSNRDSSSNEIDERIYEPSAAQKSSEETLNFIPIELNCNILSSGGIKERKNRISSECSVESDDSCVEFVHDEDGEGPYADEELVESEDDDVVFFSEVEQVDNVSSGSRKSSITPTISGSELESANNKWNDFYDAPIHQNRKKRKVSFSDHIVVHHLFVWDFASRAARIGQWEVLARDSARFQHRIQEIGAILSPVLDPKHRYRIYKERFHSDLDTVISNSLNPFHSTISIK